MVALDLKDKENNLDAKTSPFLFCDIVSSDKSPLNSALSFPESPQIQIDLGKAIHITPVCK